MADQTEGTCGGCPHFKSEPWWKQVFFIWRAGVWLGRCQNGCYDNQFGKLPHLVWWAMPCRISDPHAFTAFTGRVARTTQGES